MNYSIINPLKKHDKAIFAALFEVAAGMEPCARPRTRVVAALSYRNTIIIGKNSLKSDTFQAKYSANSDSIYSHAETAAIKAGLRAFDADISRCTLYVLRAKFKSGTRTNLHCGLAMPCEGCRKAIQRFGISRVLFTTDSDAIGALL